MAEAMRLGEQDLDEILILETGSALVQTQIQPSNPLPWWPTPDPATGMPC